MALAFSRTEADFLFFRHFYWSNKYDINCFVFGRGWQGRLLIDVTTTGMGVLDVLH